MPQKPDNLHKLAMLVKALAGKSTMLIVVQDRPDPDALASAMALRKLANVVGVQCSLACGGHVGRAENRALLKYVGVNLRSMAEIDLDRFEAIAMVDTQPGANNSLPDSVMPTIVIDHHPVVPDTRRAVFTDIRGRYGATSTILCEYLQTAGLEPDIILATALFYGIRSDTQDLGREATQADIEAYGYLYPLVNKRMLGEIQRGLVPSEYYQVLATGLHSARLCGPAIFCDLGEVHNPDMIPELADLLLRHEQVDWVLVWGYHGGQALLSVRSDDEPPDSDTLIKLLIEGLGEGGGHTAMAGGQIVLTEDTRLARRRLADVLRTRFLEALKLPAFRCRRLVKHRHEI